jgi:hypothetical protein
MYVKILRHVRDGMSRKYPEKWARNTWIFAHDNAPVQWSFVVKKYRAKHSVTALEQSPYSSDMSPPTFISFPRPETILRGQEFTATATISLTEISKKKNVFQNCFQKIYER